jgi:hypothetical protein
VVTVSGLAFGGSFEASTVYTDKSLTEDKSFLESGKKDGRQPDQLSRRER